MPDKTGLLLVNLGSPDKPTARAVRPYLFEFLHDRRVIDTSRWIWCPVLHGIILRTRPAKSARLYAKIWNQPEHIPGHEAPLVRITRTQADGIKTHLGGDIEVDVAMRYGNPSLSLGFDRLLAKGCKRVAVLPMYPQYAGPTSASVYDGVFKALRTRTNMPDIRILRDYHDHPGYIRLLADSIRKDIEHQGWEPDVVLASYHGMPQRYVDKGDPYARECKRTTQLLRAALDWSDTRIQMSFQSRFGPLPWLQPYTDVVLAGMPGRGHTSVMVITPGFSADCLETLEEINMEARKVFMESGGEKFAYIPCLNADEEHMRFLAGLVKDRLLAGWLDRIE
ncbi:MAG: ferrochelatase [Hyphomonadaceae bacterium]|nr:ferrochelatase [Hyphomonadaceae bacterium]MBC6411886.1 ferrochelatase [Hyphomonadaceae bacterium]